MAKVIEAKSRDKPYRERRIKFFKCHGDNCKARVSQSYKKRIAEAGLCRNCRRGKNINPDQQTLI